jgi:hypothetical protein
VTLDQEQGDEDGDGDGYDVRRKRRCRDLQALDGAEHRDRRRDHAVTIEQGGAEEPHHHQSEGTSTSLDRRAGERRQGEDAALAMMVGAHHVDQIFERDHDDERPNDER